MPRIAHFYKNMPAEMCVKNINKNRQNMFTKLFPTNITLLIAAKLGLCVVTFCYEKRN